MLIRQMGEPTRTSDNRSDRGAQLDWELDPELQLLAVEKPPGKLTLRAQSSGCRALCMSLRVSTISSDLEELSLTFRRGLNMRAIYLTSS